MWALCPYRPAFNQMVRVFILLWSDNILCGLLARANLQLSRKFGHAFIDTCLCVPFFRECIDGCIPHSDVSDPTATGRLLLRIWLEVSLVPGWNKVSIPILNISVALTDHVEAKNFYFMQVSALCMTRSGHLQYLNLLCLLQPILNLKVPY